MAFKVDGRGCLNKRHRPALGNSWQWVRPAASVECIRLPWNVSVTLITPRPSLSLLVTLIVRPIIYKQRALVE